MVVSFALSQAFKHFEEGRQFPSPALCLLLSVREPIPSNPLPTKGFLGESPPRLVEQGKER